MEIAACLVLVNTRVVVHHVQASMGNYALLRLLSKQMKRFLEVLLVGTDFISESLSNSLSLNKVSRSGVTVCLVTVNCSRSVAQECADRLHKKFTNLFRLDALGHRTEPVVRAKPYGAEEIDRAEAEPLLSPADIEHILSCSAEQLIQHGGNVKYLLNMKTSNKQHRSVPAVDNSTSSSISTLSSPPSSSVSNEGKNNKKGEVVVKLRDTFWSEARGPNVRIADVQLFFGMILSASISMFNSQHGLGGNDVKEISLSELTSAYQTLGEAHVRSVLIPSLFGSLLLGAPSSDHGQPGANAASKAIAREMQDAHSEDQSVNKLLLLGLKGSGRHTLLRQMISIYGTGFGTEERIACKSAVFSSMIRDITALESELIYLPDVRRQIMQFGNLVAFLETSYACFLGQSWEDKLKEVIEIWHENGLFSSLSQALNTSNIKITKTSANVKLFWLNRVQDMYQPEYIPSEADIIHIHVSGNGITEYDFTLDGNKFRFLIPDQKNERKKWIHQFEDVTAIIFLADASSFNQTVPEDENSNMLEETISLFDEVVNSRWFRERSVILWLNGRDVVEAQLKHDPGAFGRFFPDQKCQGYEETFQMIEYMFHSRNRAGERIVYTHVTCITDTHNVTAVMDATRDIIIRRSLGECGLIDGGGGGGWGGFSYSSSSYAAPAPSSKNKSYSIEVPVSKAERRAPKSGKKQKKDKQNKVDNVFADMENVFNGMAELVLWFETSPQTEHTHTPCLCFYNWDRNKAIRWVCVTIPVLFVLYVCLSAFAIAVLLPCVFWLLVVKTTKVERKVETGFAVRQEVLAKETWQQKACRVMSLLKRSIPMICLLVAWPLIIVLVILPSHPNLAEPLIGSQLVFIALLQCLGCIRSMTAWIQANREQQQLATSHHIDILQTKAARAELSLAKMTSFSAVSPSSKTLFLASTISAQGPSDAPLTESQAAVSMSSATSLSKPSTHDPPSPFSATDESLDTPFLALSRPGTWIALISLAVEALQLACVALPGNPSLTSVLFVQPVDFVPDSFRLAVQAGSSLVACLCVLALVLLFCVQLIKEVRIFGKLKKQGKQQAANKFFFHSFVGTILYGHGDMKGVSCLVSFAAAVLSDSLFLIICTNLLRAVTCVDATVCWTGSHLSLAAVSLVALSFYVPLCAMIGPLLSEARDGPAKPGEIRTAQPFLSVVTISKFVLLLLVQFFFSNNGSASPIASLVVCALMFGGMIVWTLRSGSLLILSTYSPLHGLLLPLSPPVISIWKTLSFAAGVWGGVVALVFSFLLRANNADNETSLIVLLVGLAVLLAVGAVWHRVWVRRELEVRRSMIALTLLLQGSEEVDVDIFYRAQLGDARMGERIRHTQKDRKLTRLKSTRSLPMIPPVGSKKNVGHLPPPVTGIEVDPVTYDWRVVTS